VSAAPPPPPSDDEVERRLAALKAGADPSSLGPPVRPVDPAGPPPASGSSRPFESPAASASSRPSPASATAEDAWSDDLPPALVGEVLDGSGADGHAGGRPDGGRAAPPGAGGRAVSWGISQAEAGRLGLWIGIGLVAFGAYLVLAEFVPAVALLGSLALTILGGTLVGWHVAGRAGAWALNGGAVLVGFGAARVIADLAGLPAAGWGTLGAGLGLLALAARRAWRRGGIGWQAWIGGALAIFGGWGVLGAVIPGFPTLGDLIVPLALVLVGVAVLRRGFRSGPPPA
jgi:hypothetical protein